MIDITFESNSTSCANAFGETDGVRHVLRVWGDWTVQETIADSASVRKLKEQLAQYIQLCDEQQKRINELLTFGNEELEKRREIEGRWAIDKIVMDVLSRRLAELESDENRPIYSAFMRKRKDEQQA